MGAEGCPHSARNQMPFIPQQTIFPGQGITLDTTREVSTIPRSTDEKLKWVYPSEQMFYNALARKGIPENKEKDMRMMVAIHNTLNEQSWGEILKWENKFTGSNNATPVLKSFKGRPDEPSPKARFLNIFYNTPKPFDRHDWVVDRSGKEVRYVLDYYLGEPSKSEETAIHVDIRPALDSFESCWVRFKEAFDSPQASGNKFLKSFFKSSNSFE